MKSLVKKNGVTRFVLRAETAADLMVANPISVPADATIKEATAFLADKDYGAAPVIDEAGHPVGVLSKSDILVHDREKVNEVPSRDRAVPEGFHVENVDQTRVRDLMTPAVFSVRPETPASKVIAEMLALRVHHLFVVGGDGVLVGVISALDVLRRLEPEASEVVKKKTAKLSSPIS